MAWVDGISFAKLCLRWDNWYVGLDQLMYPRQQEVAGVLDPAFLRIRDYEHFGKLDHLVEKLE